MSKKNENKRPAHWMPRAGDAVDYHSIIGGPITSQSQIVKKVGTDSVGQPVAWLAGGEDKPQLVHIDALTPADLIPCGPTPEEMDEYKMKIKFGTGKDPEWTEINVGSHDVLIQNCFCGISIETEQGLFGIAQRDDVIEILFDGKIILNSDQVKNMISNLEVASFIKTMTGLFDEASRQIEAKFEKIKQEMNGEAAELDNLEVVSCLVEHWENRGRDNE